MPIKSIKVHCEALDGLVVVDCVSDDDGKELRRTCRYSTHTKCHLHKPNGAKLCPRFDPEAERR
ncbi:MAG: hypothetical protein ACNI27_06260 [Desulfovibrio sp.]